MTKEDRLFWVRKFDAIDQHLKKIKKEGQIDYYKMLICDHPHPDLIEKLVMAGWICWYNDRKSGTWYVSP